MGVDPLYLGCQSLTFVPDSLYHDVMQQEVCISSKFSNSDQSYQLQLPRMLQETCYISNDLAKIEQNVLNCHKKPKNSCSTRNFCFKEVLVAILIYHNVLERLELFLRHFNQLMQSIDDLHLVVSTLTSDENTVRRAIQRFFRKKSRKRIYLVRYFQYLQTWSSSYARTTIEIGA